VSATATAKADYAEEVSPIRLNWGCGAHLAAGWINSDVKADPGVDLVADIRQGLPLEDGSVDYAVSVHALAELAYPELVPALEELRRVLRPEGALRLVLPDFDRAIDAYREGRDEYFKVPPEEARSIGARFLVHSLWFGYTRSLFTVEFTEELLARAGFERIEACGFRQTASPFGRIVELDNRKDESFYIEARKPPPRFQETAPYTLGVAGDELEIVDVAPDPGRGVNGHFRARKVDGRKLEIVGWVLGREQAATEVEVRAEGSIAGRTPVAVDRPDVAEQYPAAEGAETSGFRLELMAQGGGESQLEVWVVLEDGTREPLGRIVVASGPSGSPDALRRRR
jgi:predicted SAM-dependent methyltransferase